MVLAGGLIVFLFQRNALQFFSLDGAVPQVPSTVPSKQVLTRQAAAPALRRSLDNLRSAPPHGVLRGIVQDESGAFCLIGDHVLKKGDIWRDYQVISIGLRQVILKNNADRYLTLTLRD